MADPDTVEMLLLQAAGVRRPSSMDISPILSLIEEGSDHLHLFQGLGMGIPGSLGRMMAPQRPSPMAASTRPSVRQCQEFSLFSKERGAGDFTQPSGPQTEAVIDRDTLAGANASVKPSVCRWDEYGLRRLPLNNGRKQMIVRAPETLRTRDQRAGHPPEE